MARDAQTATPAGAPPTAPSAIGDAAVRSAFGFDRDDDEWLSVVGRADGEPALGRIGAYELLAEAGQGAQGRVYKAVQPGTDRPVALKRLGAGRFATTGMRLRFEREVRALASLSHPGIVTVFGADEVDGQRILLMEWIDGTPIDTWARTPPRSLRERLGAFVQVCDAVQHAHQRGVIHRDVKPSNILVGEDGRPRVLDFGLAKLIEDEGVEGGGSHAGRTNTFVGTPAYAAPEQLRGGPDAVDTRTDVYALGAILYELLTGVPPFERRADLTAMLHMIMSADPARPSSIDAGLGSEHDAIALKALAKEPERRYQSVGALADDVRRHLAGEPVLAHPPSRAYQARKFIRRHRTGVGAAALIAIALVAGATAAGWQAYRAEVERDAANVQARRAEAARAFLAEMLAFARPDQGGGPDPKVREMLDWATRRIESGALRDEPEVEAEVCASLRESYAALGLFTAAVPHAEVVLKQRRASLGEAGRESLHAARRLAVLYAECQRNEEARALMERALTIARGAYGEDDELTMACLMQMGNVLMRMGRSAEAEPIHERVLAWRRARFGDDAWATAQVGWELGAVYRDQRRFEEAVPLYERALVAARREFGDGSPDTVRVAHSLARQIYVPLGRVEDAESLLKETLERAVPALGSRHTEVIATTSSLANVHWVRGDLEKAAAGFRAGVEDSRAGDPQPNFRTAALIQALTMVLLDMRRPDEAIPLAREALEARRTLFGDSSRGTLRTRETLGEALLESGATVEAEHTLREALRGFEQHAPTDRYRWITACALAAAIARQGRLAEGETLAEEGYRSLTQSVAVVPRELAPARRRLNAIREAVGKPPEPEPATDRDAGPAEDPPPSTS